MQLPSGDDRRSPSKKNYCLLINKIIIMPKTILYSYYWWHFPCFCSNNERKTVYLLKKIFGFFLVIFINKCHWFRMHPFLIRILWHHNIQIHKKRFSSLSKHLFIILSLEWIMWKPVFNWIWKSKPDRKYSLNFPIESN